MDSEKMPDLEQETQTSILELAEQQEKGSLQIRLRDRQRIGFKKVFSFLILFLAFLPLAWKSYYPWILGRYSLPYFILALGWMSGLFFLQILVARYGRKIFLILASQFLAFFVCLALIEVAGQIDASFHPGYSTLFLEPHPVLGWKGVPNLRWISTGDYWYSLEFSVPIQMNASGFNDDERTVAKPDHTMRIALLGDSFVEAFQVPQEKTAASLLEKKLNKAGDVRYEVFNFGVSNYSVGQEALLWNEWVKQYQPDYVFAFVSELQMLRTNRSYETGAFPFTESAHLSVRPAFSIKNGKLVRQEETNEQTFQKLQEGRIKLFHGKRTAKNPRGLFLHQFFLKLKKIMNDFYFRPLMKLQHRLSGRILDPPVSYIDSELFQTNLRILEQLGTEVLGKKAQFVVVDANRYFFPVAASDHFSDELKSFCAQKDFGYVDLGSALLRARRGGVSLQWKYDLHFNEAGNEVFERSLETWLRSQLGKNPIQRG